jgi:Bacterial PH domain/Short C-terminal domain
MTSEPRLDIAAAADRIRNTYGTKNEIKHLEEYLEPGEVVSEIAGGRFGKGNGLLALTDRRIVFVFHGVVRTGLEEFRLPVLTAVSSSGGVIWASISLTLAGRTARIESIDKTDAKRMVDAIRLTLSARTPTPAMVDIPAQIKKLADLRDAGVLTTEEFEAKKTDLLARM